MEGAEESRLRLTLDLQRPDAEVRAQVDVYHDDSGLSSVEPAFTLEVALLPYPIYSVATPHRYAMTHHDYSDEVHPERSRGLRALYIFLGVIFTGLGIAGVILPLIPGTPLLLIALFFYARASTRLYNWLLNNRLVGPVLCGYRRHRKMPRRVKPRAICAVILAFSLSAWFALESPWYRLGWLALGLGVAIFISRLPTFDDDND